MIRCIALACVFALVAGAPGVAQPATDADLARRIDALLEPRIATHEANGTVLVFRDGVEIYRRHIGMANFEQGAPVNDRTIFPLASLTKSFTAGAALMLRADGTLRFEAPLSDYMPDFPRSADIRVFHPLAHMSGLGDVEDPPEDRPYGLEETIAGFTDQPLTFEPGAGNRYSNAGYVLSARLLEIASGQSYDDLLQRRIFTPLGMTSAGNYLREEVVPGRAQRYFPGPGGAGVTNALAPNLSQSQGAGSLSMTADDLMKWLEAVRTARLFDIWAQEFPFGWGRRRYFDTLSIEQSGLNRGAAASSLIVPDHNLSVLCLFNTQSGFALSCSAQVAAVVLDQPSPKQSLNLDLPRVPLDAATSTNISGLYLSETGWRLRIAEFHGSLYYTWATEWRPLTPASEGRFLLLPDSALFTLRQSPSGDIVGLDYRDGSQSVVLTRAPEAVATSGQMH